MDWKLVRHGNYEQSREVLCLQYTQGGFSRAAKKFTKAGAYGTRTDATRYARGKSANFVPTHKIFADEC